VSGSATTAGVGIDTVAHENGHMWFGDDVTLSQWKDIWLNEGMTEFSTWLWSNQEDGGPSTLDQYAARYAYADEDEDTDGVADHEDFWAIAPAAPPTSVDIFNGDAMYERGAATMAAIRALLSDGADDERFRSMMHRWLTEHAYGNVTTEEFIALVKETDPSRADRWTEFFRQWLYTSYPGTPSPTNRPQINVDNFDTSDITP
jgi:aminopeptidase N